MPRAVAPGAANERTSVAAWAEEAGVTPRHFRDRFVAAHGEPVASAWRRRRLDAAAAALVLQGSDVCNAAFDAGYGSPEAFARAFGRRFGLPPSAVARGKPPADPHLAQAMAMAMAFALSLSRCVQNPAEGSS
jgi:transcriptional regulator GlxA family with amidase domain